MPNILNGSFRKKVKTVFCTYFLTNVTIFSLSLYKIESNKIYVGFNLFVLTIKLKYLMFF